MLVDAVAAVAAVAPVAALAIPLLWLLSFTAAVVLCRGSTRRCQ